MTAPDVGPGAPPERLTAAAALCRDLAGRRGIPEIVETAAESLPGSTTGNVVYDLGVALALALGDLAEALDVAAETADEQPGETSAGGDLPGSAASHASTGLAEPTASSGECPPSEADPGGFGS